MRMISQGLPPHNVRSRRRVRYTAGPALLLLAASLFFGACNEDGKSQEPSSEPAAAIAPDCPLRVDVSVWEEFKQTGERILAGQNPTRGELGAFASLPMTTLWIQGLKSSVPIKPYNLTNWMEEAFSKELGIQGQGKTGGTRMEMAMNYRFSFDHRDQIDSLLKSFASRESACELTELLDLWIDAENLPDDLTIAFLPGKPEIRAVDNVILLDTGLLAAVGSEQILGQIAGLAYIWFQRDHGTDPNEIEGEDSLAGAFVKVRDEGIATWISNRPFLYFKSEHPVLGKVDIVSERYLKVANMAVANADSNLPALFADPELMAQLAQNFSRRMTVSEGFTHLGYSMAAAIDGNLGPERLHQAARTASGFLDAYQEAAALNPLPRPHPGAIGHPWYASLRPFDEDLYRQLRDLLVRRGL